MILIEKAILADVCLGLPLGKIVFSVPSDLDPGSLPPAPDCYLFRGEQLAVMKALYARGEERIAEAVAELVRTAEAAMQDGPFSVTQKPRSRFSDDPHDYQSLAKYWWPNPDTADGLPYVQRDGAINPECYSEDFDNIRLARFSETVVLLALAAYLSGRTEFAARAALLLNTWFVDASTRQTPHFRFAQKVSSHGKERVRLQSIVEARFLIYVTEAVRLLSDSDALSRDSRDAIQKWFSALLTWLLESDAGRAAKLAKNNIGFWYDLQCVVYAQFCGQEELAERILRDDVAARLKAQVAADGSLPRELGRAFPQDYVVFTLAAMVLISRAGEHSGLRLWDQREGDGRSFQLAHDWLLKTGETRSLLAGAATEAGSHDDGFDDTGFLLETGIKLRAFQHLAEAESETASQLLAENEKLKQKLRQAEEESGRLAALNARLKEEREAALAHAKDLEARYRRMLQSTSWRATAPMRIVVRSFRSLLSGKPGRRNHDPRLPTPSSLTGERGRTKRPVGIADRIKATARNRLPPAVKNAVKAVVLGAPSRQTMLRTLSHVASKAKPAGRADPLEMLLAARPRNEEALKQEYRDKGLDGVPDTFVLYRIIGNDLYPRHKKGQSRENVQFLLKNEPDLADCEKRWVVNRIIDAREEEQIVALLEAHGQPFLHIPFVADEYRKIGWDFDALPKPGFLASEAFAKLAREEPQLFHDRAIAALYRRKNNYVMNNNGARNAALADGRQRAKWVLPWDGNSFVTGKAWAEIRAAVTARPHLKYFAVPMERVTDNALLLSDDFTPHPVEEPQLLFRRDAEEAFNVEFCYGRRPKVEMFWRLGIPGPWDRWRDDPWEQKRRAPSPEAGQFGVAGWVARMNSGVAALEQKDRTSFKVRGRVRQEAILAAIDHVDCLVHGAHGDPDQLAFYSPGALDCLKQALCDDLDGRQALAHKIIADAEAALASGPYSVVQKTTLPPSGDAHDYWHPAPYWWPDPDRKDGLPYIKKDGHRVPGTRMYEAASAQYDRTRLQLMFDGTTALALGWYLTGREDLAAHGARLVRSWFLDPATCMNPHLRFSQVRRGHNNDEGYESGIIEFKDLYYVLDAVRLLEKSGTFREEDSEGLRTWLRAYQAWLETSRQGMKEVAATNNHGTYFDLQTAAIAAYLGDRAKLRDICLRALSRIPQQFTEDGEQPQEMKRSMSQHYVFFNLQGWLNLLQLARANGLPPCDWTAEPAARIARAFRWIAGHDVARWPYEQVEPFDTDRLIPLALSARNGGIVGDEELRSLIGDRPPISCKSIFNPHDAVPPHWNILDRSRQLNDVG